MSTTEDMSPNSLPFSSRMRELAGTRSGPHPEVAHTTFAYVDIAKRMLLELRVREFTAADVVALAAIMEGRDRDLRKGTRQDHDV